MYKYFKIVDNKITSWESKGFSNEKISFFPRLINNQPPSLAYDSARIKLKFNGDFLKQDKVTYNHGSLVNIYIVYRLGPFTNSTKSATLENCLFVAVKLTKNTDIGKQKYSRYGVGFDSRGSFTYPSGRYCRNVFIFGADLSNSAHPNNKTRSTSVLGKDFIQGIVNTTVYAEEMYSTNFTGANKKFCLSLRYNGDSSYPFVNGKEIINFKAKDSEIVPYPLCHGNISKGFTIPYRLETGLFGYVYDFSVDY